MRELRDQFLQSDDDDGDHYLFLRYQILYVQFVFHPLFDQILVNYSPILIHYC